MDLIALAVPFFLLAIIIELFVDWRKRTGYYRSNDAINSISAGMLDTTLGYFTKILPLLGWGFAMQHLAVFDMPLAWFDASARGIALWVLAALAWDFCYYWFHRFSHEISILWAAHAVHHQSEDYNLSTALRQTSTGFLFGWIFYLPLFVVGFPLEVLLAVNAVNLIYQFWVHTQLVRRLGPLEAVLMTPSHHRVHHAQNERYIDRNYGGMLIVWDRLFGTYEPESDDDPVVFGVRKPLASWNPFWANLQVYDYLLFDARKAQRWRDKIGIWFRRTGWRPPDVEARYPKQRTDLAHFEKYDPPVAAGIRRYAVAQFALAIVFILWIGELYVSGGARAVLLPCVALWLLLLSLGWLNQGKAAAGSVELVRLLVVTPVLLLLAHQAGMVITTVTWAVAALYIAGSALWLVFARNGTEVFA
ncbi:MAG: sterol desaturase family protein [Gammaproteobacteria bacterium]|nr:sterol desaturase family protein [Gammaproteobacteria bacterium]MDH5619414.1 sterol desaturase family protein [Gammaproteobacteria bacterium]